MCVDKIDSPKVYCHTSYCQYVAVPFIPQRFSQITMSQTYTHMHTHPHTHTHTHTHTHSFQKSRCFSLSLPLIQVPTTYQSPPPHSPLVPVGSLRGGHEEGLEVSIDGQLQHQVIGGVACHHPQHSAHIGVLQVPSGGENTEKCSTHTYGENKEMCVYGFVVYTGK